MSVDYTQFSEWKPGEPKTPGSGKWWAQKTSDEAAVHQAAAERLTGEAAALVAKANDLARLRSLATTQDT